jgi:hypothetical protein
MALLDFLHSGGQGPFLVETDTSVPDVFKAYQEEVAGELVNLDEREGWIELVNLVASKAESTIVINTGARNQTGVSNFGRTLSKALGELGRKLVVLWMIDRKRESLELLSDFMAAIPEAEVHVVRNLYLGSEKKFELYNGSKMKSAIEGKGSKSISLPELADRVTDAMNKGRMTIEKATGELSLGDRMELERWREECAAMLSQVVSGRSRERVQATVRSPADGCRAPTPLQGPRCAEHQTHGRRLDAPHGVGALPDAVSGDPAADRAGVARRDRDHSSHRGRAGESRSGGDEEGTPERSYGSSSCDREAARPGRALQMGERRGEHRVHHGDGSRVGRKSAGPGPRRGGW